MFRRFLLYLGAAVLAVSLMPVLTVESQPSYRPKVLNDLKDVNAGTPGDTEVLTWDAGTSRWIAAAAAAGVTIGTANTIAKFNAGADDLADSLITDDGSDLYIGDDVGLLFGLVAENTELYYSSGSDFFGIISDKAIHFYGVNNAGVSTDIFDFSTVLTAMDNSDTTSVVDIAVTNADHTGATNVLNAINIGNITGDAQTLERGISIGSGWSDSNGDTDILFVDNDAVIGFALRLYFKSDSSYSSSTSFEIDDWSGDSFTFATSTWRNGWDLMSVVGTAAAMNGSDTMAALLIDIANADHTGSGNYVYGINIDDITGDAQAIEEAIHLGTGWDREIWTVNDFDVESATGLYVWYSSYDAVIRFDTYQGPGGSNDFIKVWDTVDAMNGSDTVRILHLDFTNADHTGSSNYLSFIEIDAFTGDAEATESILTLGTGPDYFIFDPDGVALGTLTWTTNSDKTANAKSGTIKVWINGALYHIQLYADS